MKEGVTYTPLHYDGISKTCRGILNQCTICFEVLAHHFSSDRAEVAYIVSLQSGKALVWASPHWKGNDPVMFNCS